MNEWMHIAKELKELGFASEGDRGKMAELALKDKQTPNDERSHSPLIDFIFNFNLLNPNNFAFKPARRAHMAAAKQNLHQ